MDTQTEVDNVGVQPVIADARGNGDYREYDAFLARLQEQFLANTEQGKVPLFTTDTSDLFSVYLNTFPEGSQRQYHNCHACRYFLNRFGGLVSIGADGRIESPIWHIEDAPDVYKPAIAALLKQVKRAKVNGVFLSADKIWGQPKTGIWRHSAVTPPAPMVFKQCTLTAGQVMAEKLEDFKTVMRALREFPLSAVAQALTLLKTESLYRSEKVMGPAQWLYDLHTATDAAHGNLRANVVWRAVASAPPGFCHPRSSMIGTLLEDIVAGLDFAEVSRRFAKKMRSTQYQRPQAAPKAGAIAQAEKIVEQLKVAGSLARRFARLEEVDALWKPQEEEKTAKPGAGVFSHLQPKNKDARPLNIPSQTMTWEKFARTILPEANKVEFFVPLRGNFTGLLTAVNAEAPPILQWDTEEQRNPVSSYVWVNGSSAVEWGLHSRHYVTVTAITLNPAHWYGNDQKFTHQGQTVIFLLDGARETRMAGTSIFPEILKAEFHSIRSVIEAYSKSATIEGMAEGSACGYVLSKGEERWDARLRVTTKGQVLEYILDRWD